MHIKEAIQKILEDNDISKYRLSKNIGVTPSLINRYLQGDVKSINSRVAKSIFDFYGYQIDPFTKKELEK